MAKDERNLASREKGFWFLLSTYIGAATAAYVVLVLLLAVDAVTYAVWTMFSLVISVPVVLLLRWGWRRRHPRVEDTDERERVIRGWARQVAGCTLLAVLCLACTIGTLVANHYGVLTVNFKVEWLMHVMIGGCVVWELAREITVRVAHQGERRRGKE